MIWICLIEPSLDSVAFWIAMSSSTSAIRFDVLFTAVVTSFDTFSYTQIKFITEGITVVCKASNQKIICEISTNGDVLQIMYLR